MKNLSMIIKHYRQLLNLTREQLASGICSSKYIYLIEQGKRNPSADVIVNLGVRMGIDLFEFMPYIDCHDPIKVKLTMDLMEKLRHQREYEKLNTLTMQLKTDIDFSINPWHYELAYNEMIYILFEQKDFQLVYDLLTKHIVELGGNPSNPSDMARFITPSLLRLNNLLSIYYFMIGDDDKGRSYLESFYYSIQHIKQIKKYQEMYISITLNFLNAIIEANKIEEGLRIAESLLSFQIENNKINRIHLTYFLYANALYYKGLVNEAIENFRKSIHFGIGLSKEIEFFDLFTYTFVKEIIEKDEISLHLYNEVYLKQS